jgi:hypothetical protein
MSTRKRGMTTMTTGGILFYSDMGPESDQAFPVALDLAIAKRRQRLSIVYVLHSPYRFRGDIVEPGLAMGLNPEIIDVAEESLRERYGAALERFPRTSFHVLSGVAGVEILRFIRKHRVEQLVVARSVAQRKIMNMPTTLEGLLLTRCPCPTVFVAPGRRTQAHAAHASAAPKDSGIDSNVIRMDGYRDIRESRKYHRGGFGS